MARIHWRNRAPVTVLIDQPSTRPQALHHAPNGHLLLAREPEQHQARANQIERPWAERIQGILEDVVSVYLEIRNIKPLQVGDVDIGRHHPAILAHPLRQPDGHRSPARADFETAPARQDQVTPSAGSRIEDLLQEAQPLVFEVPAPMCSEAVAGLESETLTSSCRISTLRHRSSLQYLVCANERHLRNLHTDPAC